MLCLQSLLIPNALAAMSASKAALFLLWIWLTKKLFWQGQAIALTAMPVKQTALLSQSAFDAWFLADNCFNKALLP